MGGRATPYVMGILHDTEKIHRRNSFFHVVWVRGSIPLEMGFPTMRTDWFDNINNEQLLSNNLDLAEEPREVAAVRLE